MALVPQVRLRAQLSTTACSYLLKRQVWLLKVHMEEVSNDRQNRGSRRVVVGTPPFEVIGKEQKDDSTQQESAGIEEWPEGSHEAAHRCEHGSDVHWLHCCLKWWQSWPLCYCACSKAGTPSVTPRRPSPDCVTPSPCCYLPGGFLSLNFARPSQNRALGTSCQPATRCAGLRPGARFLGEPTSFGKCFSETIGALGFMVSMHVRELHRYLGSEFSISFSARDQGSELILGTVTCHFLGTHYMPGSSVTSLHKLLLSDKIRQILFLVPTSS